MPVVVATEDDPARGEWLRAVRDVREAAPHFVPWSAVIASEAEFQPGEVVFAERLYPGPGTNPVGGQRKRYADLQAALEQLDAAAAKDGARLAAPVEPTLLALDRTKRDELPGRPVAGRGPHPGRPTGVRPGRRPVRRLPARVCQHPAERRERVDLRARTSAALAISGFVIPVFAAGMLRH